MPHINHAELDQVLFDKLFRELQLLIGKTREDKAASVLGALLTPTEQVMLTKRFAAIMFLHRGMTPYEVWNTLKMSPSTIARIQYEYTSGVYGPLVKTLTEQTTKDFLRILELVLSAGLPPRSGKRWQHVKAMSRK